MVAFKIIYLFLLLSLIKNKFCLDKMFSTDLFSHKSADHDTNVAGKGENVSSRATQERSSSWWSGPKKPLFVYSK